MTILHKIPPVESHSVFSQDHRVKFENQGTWHLAPPDRNRTEELGGL